MSRQMVYVAHRFSEIYYPQSRILEHLDDRRQRFATNYGAPTTFVSRWIKRHRRETENPGKSNISFVSLRRASRRKSILDKNGKWEPLLARWVRSMSECGVHSRWRSKNSRSRKRDDRRCGHVVDSTTARYKLVRLALRSHSFSKITRIPRVALRTEYARAR